MMGEYKGKFYAEVFRSQRFVGTTILELKEFNSEKEMEEFIHEYNSKHLDFNSTGAAPEIYTMAQSASWYTIMDFIKVGENI